MIVSFIDYRWDNNRVNRKERKHQVAEMIQRKRYHS